MAETMNVTTATETEDETFTVKDLRSAMDQLDEALNLMQDIQEQLARRGLSSEVVDDVLDNLPVQVFTNIWDSNEHRGWWQNAADDETVCDLMQELADSADDDDE